LWLGSLAAFDVFNPLYAADKRLAMLCTFACIAGSVIPDIDVKWSVDMRTKTFMPFKKRTLLSNHRGWTHHLFLIIFLAVVGFFIQNQFIQSIFLAFALGIAIHDFADMLSPLGIPYFTYQDRIHFTMYKTGKLSEFAFVSIATIGLIALSPHSLFAYQGYYDNNAALQQAYQKSLELKQQEEALKHNKKQQEELKNHILIFQNNNTTQRANSMAKDSYKTFQGRQNEVQNDMVNFANQNNIEVANLMPKKGNQVLASNSYIYIFMSTSVPFEVWRNYAFAINKLRHEGQGNIALVLRGCVGGCTKVMPTVKFVQKVLTSGNTKLLVPVIIDPTLFNMYNIQRVPVFVYAKNVNTVNPSITPGAPHNLKNSVTAYKVVGDWSFQYGLEKLYSESNDPALVKLYNLLNKSWFQK
jgi:type-F conjugative transfer system pilin assembly protein TrbC